jgi:anaerobic ribonucleoside-triphosphate reductase
MTTDSIDTYSNPAINENIKNQMTQLQDQLTNVASQIANKMEEMYNQDKTVVSKMNMNDEQFKKQILMYKTVTMREQKEHNLTKGHNLTEGHNLKEGMQNMTISDINGLLQDTDLHVLQENYGYMFWTILAAGLLTITINVMRRE